MQVPLISISLSFKINAIPCSIKYIQKYKLFQFKLEINKDLFKKERKKK